MPPFPGPVGGARFPLGIDALPAIPGNCASKSCQETKIYATVDRYLSIVLISRRSIPWLSVTFAASQSSSATTSATLTVLDGHCARRRRIACSSRTCRRRSSWSTAPCDRSMSARAACEPCKRSRIRFFDPSLGAWCCHLLAQPSARCGHGADRTLR
jgi:hypothetical protein